MKRVFFEKDPNKDYLFVIADANDSSEVYRVSNFTDESGMEYVYTLIGERKAISEDKLIENVIPLSTGNFKNYNGEGELSSPLDCLESMIDFKSLNKDNEIYIYVRNK